MDIYQTTLPGYDKPYHFWDSPMVFLDIDSFVYIMVLAVVIWLIVMWIRKRKCKRRIGYIEFHSRFMFFCSLPVFILYLCQIIPSGYYTLNSCSICVLPIVYGALIQLIFFIVRKIMLKRK